MTEEDEKDYEKFLEGIEFFAKLDVQRHMEHIKRHKEDALCTIRHFSGTGLASCTMNGIQGLRSLVQRRVKARDDGKNFAVDEVFQCVSDQIGPGLRDGTQRGESPEEIFERVCAQALKSVQDRQKQRTYHFPCVLAGAKSPEQFSIGPVQFTISSLFRSRLVALNPQEKKFSERVQDPEASSTYKSSDGLPLSKFRLARRQFQKKERNSRHEPRLISSGYGSDLDTAGE